jgi:hypothetical protein
MLASSDPASYVVLILLGLALLLALRLRRARAQRRRDMWALAEAVGHPSAWRHPPGHAGRLRIADEAAERLAATGLIATRSVPGISRVTARGLDGEYVLTVASSGIFVGYRSNSGWVDLGIYAAAEIAVEAIAEHAELPTRS